MKLDEATIKFNQIFQPEVLEETLAVVNENKRFVYYTSADTAMEVLRNQELWFTKATVINDYSGVSYGLGLIGAVFSGQEGQRFKAAAEDIFPGTIQRAEKLLMKYERDWELETYTACLSIHKPEEDQQGRPSMWSADRDTALVVNSSPMTSATNLLAVFFLPVLYVSKEGLANYLSEITDAILTNRTYLKGLGQETLVAYINIMLFRFAIATKHPNFAEEKEWLLFYRPTERMSPGMTEDTVVLGGVSQKIYKLRLADEPENGLRGADIPSLLDRIIVGPTKFPNESYQAFVEVLSESGVEDAPAKVMLSDIPFRTQ